MSKWKPIDQSEITNEVITVHKSFTLDNSTSGQKFIQFKSGSSTDFSSNDSGSYWDTNQVNFYLSGSSLHYTSKTSSYHDGLQYSGIGQTAFMKGFSRETYTHKFHSTGSTLSIIIKDDGNGNLYAPSASISSSTTALSSSDNYIGNISYDLGIINITETGSFSHTPSTATIGVMNPFISHSQEIHISASDLSTTVKFMVNSGSITGSDDTNLFYFESDHDVSGGTGVSGTLKFYTGGSNPSSGGATAPPPASGLYWLL